VISGRPEDAALAAAAAVMDWKHAPGRGGVLRTRTRPALKLLLLLLLLRASE